MLTTCKYHKCSLMEVTTRGHKTVRKPDCVISYNKAKKGVDISDNWCLRNWKFVTYSESTRLIEVVHRCWCRVSVA
ncbi:hypothetical protein M0802_013962 [Mischocyttarus mexicanus]|nr:hypothetical protein M0802_013962 [Mischocyttarus mexicanus]